MAATAGVIWLCACVRYWLDHGLVFEFVTCFYCCFQNLKKQFYGHAKFLGGNSQNRASYLSFSVYRCRVRRLCLSISSVKNKKSPANAINSATILNLISFSLFDRRERDKCLSRSFLAVAYEHCVTI